MSNLVETGKSKVLQLCLALSIENGVRRAIELFKRYKYRALVNIGGEHYEKLPVIQGRKNCVEDTKKYISLIGFIKNSEMPGIFSISIKPTQIDIVENAVTCGVTVELDMEQLETVRETADVFIAVVKKFPRCLMRIAVQAELKNSLDLAKEIVKAGGGVRLVRGKAYSGINENKVFKTNEEIIDNYLKIAEVVPVEKLALGTGNPEVLKKVYETIGSDAVEHQFLFGLPYHEKLYSALAKEGKRVTLYMPTGKWEKVRDYVSRRNYLSEEEIKAMDVEYKC